MHLSIRRRPTRHANPLATCRFVTYDPRTGATHPANRAICRIEPTDIVPFDFCNSSTLDPPRR
jgi:hypothetical protein